MAVVQRLTGDCVITGNLKCSTLDVGGEASTKRNYRQIVAQESATNAAAATRVAHVVVGATATIEAVQAGAVVVATGDSTATVDVKKNGTTILSGTIALNNSQAAREVVDGAISSGAAVAGDVIEVYVTVSAGTGTLAKGVFVVLDIIEDAA